MTVGVDRGDSGRGLGGRWLAVMLVFLVALAACGGDSDEPGSGLSSDEEEAAATTESTTSTTATTTTTLSTTTTEAPSTDEEVRDELLATVETFWAAYVGCLADPAACDVEASLGAMIDHPLRGDIDGALAQWAGEGLQFESDEEILYRRHDLALEDPDTYALEVCLEASVRAIYEVADDGSREKVGDQSPLARFQQFALEEKDDGGFVIKTMASNQDETVEGESCDAYREG